MLRVVVVVLVVAVGIVACVSYEQVVDPSEPAQAQSVAEGDQRPTHEPCDAWLSQG
jgi:hypothetical protein